MASVAASRNTSCPRCSSTPRVWHVSSIMRFCLGDRRALTELHAQPTQCLAEIGHPVLIVMLQHEHVHDAAIGIHERCADADPFLRSRGALEQIGQRPGNGMTESFRIHGGSSLWTTGGLIRPAWRIRACRQN